MKNFLYRFGSAMALVVMLAFALSFSSPAAAEDEMIPVGWLLNRDGTLNTTTGASGTLDLRGSNVALDAKRGPVLSPRASAIDPSQSPILSPRQAAASVSNQDWSPLPNNGLNGTVRALAVIGTELYVGGSFTGTADTLVTNLNQIARFSGGVWSPLPNNGLGGDFFAEVNALAVVGSDLYAGGTFTQTADGAVTNLNGIAKFSGGVWSALPHNGLNGGVAALAVVGSDLYIGGSFTQTADGAVPNLNGIARFSGGAWSALPHNGLNGGVFALAVSGSDLYAGGSFAQTGDGAVTNLNNIAKLSGGVWSPLPHNGLNSEVHSIVASGSDVYVGGIFTQTANGAVTNLNNIARLSGGAWSPLPHGGLNGDVRALAISGGDPSTGSGQAPSTGSGQAPSTGSGQAPSTGSGQAPSTGSGQAPSTGSGQAPSTGSGQALFVGGLFTQTADGALTDLNRIAKLSGGAWSPLPHGGLNSSVLALKASGGKLYTGGSFTRTADNVVLNLNRIADAPCLGNPTNIAPLNNATLTKTKVKLDWSDTSCATFYKLKVKDTTTKTVFLKDSDIAKSKFKVKNLTQGHTYWWQVRACNEEGCSKGPKWHFEVNQ